MITLGMCDCGRKGIKIKFGGSVCKICDKIEREVLPLLFRKSEAEKLRDLEGRTVRYFSNSYLE